MVDSGTVTESLREFQEYSRPTAGCGGRWTGADRTISRTPERIGRGAVASNSRLRVIVMKKRSIKSLWPSLPTLVRSVSGAVAHLEQQSRGRRSRCGQTPSSEWQDRRCHPRPERQGDQPRVQKYPDASPRRHRPVLKHEQTAEPCFER